MDLKLFLKNLIYIFTGNVITIMDLNVFQCVKAIKDRWEIDFVGFLNVIIW